jgi:hypothetical protein
VGKLLYAGDLEALGFEDGADAGGLVALDFDDAVADGAAAGAGGLELRRQRFDVAQSDVRREFVDDNDGLAAAMRGRISMAWELLTAWPAQPRELEPIDPAAGRWIRARRTGFAGRNRRGKDRAGAFWPWLKEVRPERSSPKMCQEPLAPPHPALSPTEGEGARRAGKGVAIRRNSRDLATLRPWLNYFIAVSSRWKSVASDRVR